MHRRLAELLEYTQGQRAQLLTAVSLVPETLRDFRADQAGWSVAEVLEHLHRVESGIVRLLRHGIQRASTAGAEVEDEEESLLGSLDAFELSSGTRPIRAPEPVMPRGELDAAQAILALESSRHDLLDAARQGNGLALGAITYPHPFFGMLNLYQWILFVGQHEARHADQVRRIAARLAEQPSHGGEKPMSVDGEV